MAKAIIVFNTGSSSVKFSLFIEHGNDLKEFIGGQIEGLHGAAYFSARDQGGKLVAEKSWPESDSLDHNAALDHLFGYLPEMLGDHSLKGIGHRVVHGGQIYRQAVRITPEVVENLTTLVPLAPLHQPHNLTPIRRLLKKSPELPQVACFDTSFHRQQPTVAQLFALPSHFREKGILRYGFHGLSYEYIASILPQLDPRAASGKCVVLHLGNGASMCAICQGKSIASTMGFTAVEGLMMGTRCGSLDPGVVLFMIDELKMDVRQIEQLLYKESGLLGVSGLSHDMRELLASESPEAKLAVELFVYRIRCALGALSGALGGLDALVFTAGIGEHAEDIRHRVCDDASWLGVDIDQMANKKGGEQQRISSEKSRVAVYVIPTDEELMIARHTRRLLTE